MLRVRLESSSNSLSLVLGGPFPSSSSSRNVRTLTRLAINLFAVLNVILFYCWIKRTGNLMVRPVHVTCPSYVSCVMDKRCILERVRVQVSKSRKKGKFNVIKKNNKSIN